MRVKLLRSLAKNLFELMPPSPEEADGIKDTFDKDAPWVEGQVREVPDKAAQYLFHHQLAEETTEDVTVLPPSPPVKGAKAAPATKIPPKTDKGDHK